MPYAKRILEEQRNLYENDYAFCRMRPVDTLDYLTWEASILGPKNTPYFGGLFKLEIKYPTDYPFKPMKVRFITPIYNINVNKEGEVSFDVLQSNWTPAFKTEKVL